MSYIVECGFVEVSQRDLLLHFGFHDMRGRISGRFRELPQNVTTKSWSSAAISAKSGGLVAKSFEYLLLILSQVQYRQHQDTRRLRLIENSVRKSLHHLPSNILKINGRDLWEGSSSGKISIDCCHELR